MRIVRKIAKFDAVMYIALIAGVLTVGSKASIILLSLAAAIAFAIVVRDLATWFGMKEN